jgi:hypothetical protein
MSGVRRRKPPRDTKIQETLMDDGQLIRARSVEHTRVGKLLDIVVLPWALGWLLLSDALLSQIGLSNDVRPGWLKLIWLSVALVPLGVAILSGLAPGRPIIRLFAEPAPWVRISQRGIEVWRRPGRPYRWDEIECLTRVGGLWELSGVDGTLIAEIPESLTYPSPGWTDARSLAERIVDYKPELFQLAGQGGLIAGASEFVPAGPDAERSSQRTSALVPRLLIIGLLAFGVVMLIVLWTQGPPG